METTSNIENIETTNMVDSTNTNTTTNEQVTESAPLTFAEWLERLRKNYPQLSEQHPFYRFFQRKNDE